MKASFMKRILTLFTTLLTVWTVQAQLNGSGYYRVQNYGSQRYAYLCDRKGSVDYTTQNADVGAIQLWKDINRAYDDPASVMYIKPVGSDAVDIQAQGVGLNQIIGHYALISDQGNNKYYVYASQAGVTKYLGDARTNSKDEGLAGFNAVGNYRLWSLFAINETDNYLGITPSVNVNGKYYAPYYVSFPFRRVSAGMKVYYIKKVDTEFGIAVMEEITSDIIPAATPVIIECSSATASENKIMPVTGGGSNPAANLLGGVYFCNPKRVSPYVGVPFDAAKMRTLSVLAEGKLGFISDPSNLTKVDIEKVGNRMCLPANSSYLKVANGTPAELLMLNQADYEAYVKEHSTVNATAITLSQNNASLHVGETVTLTATVTPDNTTNKAVTWKSSNTSVATVENGKITAVALGEATITATTADGTNLSASCKVTVEPTKVTSITLSKNTASLHVGETVTLTATVKPDDATDKTVTWKSSNDAVATVDNGKVTAVALGEATITATTADGTNLSASCKVTVEPTKVTSITLSKNTASLHVGETVTLTATVKPDDATDKTVTWKSSNDAVATVDNGKVTAVALGEATITATTADGTNLTATCAITVNPIKAASITLSQTTAELFPGDKITLTATVLPENATDKRVTWMSSNSSIATVSEEGIVTAVAVGETTITAKTADGTNLTATCAVKVNPIKVSSITLSQTTATLYPTDQLQLTATVLPDNATNKGIEWESSNTAVATVSEGIVVAVAPGEAVITVRTTDGSNLSATCAVTVKPILATSITLSQTAANATVGDRLQLKATVLPDNTTDKSVTWSTSAPDVATVDAEGIVIVVGAGEAVITATTNDGTNLQATCTLTAVPATVLATSITLDVTEAELGIGRTLQLTATILPEDVSTHGVTWSSSNDAVAIVNEMGLVTALAEGETVITAATVDGTELTATCTMTVVPVKAERIELNYTEDTVLKLGETLQFTATITPDDATDKTVTWSTSDENVATVDEEGLVTAVGIGEAIITATTADGTELSASCTITVEPILAESITLDITKADMVEEDVLQLTATVLPDETTVKTVEWSTSDETVATVDEQGLVTAVAPGTVIITVSTTDGSDLSATCTITVSPKVGIFHVNATNGEGQIFTLDGRKLNTLQKGINIVRMADGSVRRITVK